MDSVRFQGPKANRRCCEEAERREANRCRMVLLHHKILTNHSTAHSQCRRGCRKIQRDSRRSRYFSLVNSASFPLIGLRLSLPNQLPLSVPSCSKPLSCPSSHSQFPPRSSIFRTAPLPLVVRHVHLRGRNQLRPWSQLALLT